MRLVIKIQGYAIVVIDDSTVTTLKALVISPFTAKIAQELAFPAIYLGNGTGLKLLFSNFITF